MPKGEKDQRKLLKQQWRKQTADAFDERLPMSREEFKALFDYLDEQLSEEDCDDTLRFVRAFLQTEPEIDAEAVVRWLGEQGGGCDCEVLANVEERFG